MPPQTADQEANMALTEPLNLSCVKKETSPMRDEKTDGQLRVEDEFSVPIYELLDVLFTQCEFTYDEISEKIDVPRRTVNTWINDLGVSDYASRMDADADELKRGRAMYKAELKVGEPLDDWLFEQYWKEGRSTYDLGKEFDSAGNTISRWMKRLDFPRRDDAEQFANHWDSMDEDEQENWIIHRTSSGWQDPDGENISSWRDENDGGTGSDHPRWVDNSFTHIVESLRHGLSDEPWVKQAERIRDEYDRECYCCGDHEDDLDRGLNVHHIVPLRAGGVNADELLIPLCTGCHMRVENSNVDTFPRIVTEVDK